MTLEEKINEIVDEATRYLYAIDSEVTPEQYEVISDLRQLINEVYVKEDKQVSNQFLYDKLKGILK